MRNFTNYSDQYILSLMEDCNANPHKTTANVQYAVGFNKLIPVLCIYQDFSQDWDYDDRCIFCEETALLDFCDEMHTSLWDMKAMLDYYAEPAFQANVNDIEYEDECIELDRLHDKWMAEELAWYNHARMMGWE